MKNQKGFAPLVIILLVVLGVSVVGGGYIIFKNKAQDNKLTAKVQDLQNKPITCRLEITKRGAEFMMDIYSPYGGYDDSPWIKGFQGDVGQVSWSSSDSSMLQVLSPNTGDGKELRFRTGKAGVVNLIATDNFVGEDCTVSFIGTIWDFENAPETAE
jgi:hypothetical protein